MVFSKLLNVIFKQTFSLYKMFPMKQKAEVMRHVDMPPSWKKVDSF